MEVKISPANSLKGTVKVPGDKSITHRAFMFSLIANGETVVENYGTAVDCTSTLNIVSRCGAEIVEKNENAIRIKSGGIFRIKEPEDVLDAGNSGTTMRLLSGLFSGVKNKLFVLTGDESLRKRPMKRITEPLGKMGAKIFAREGGKYAPIAIYGGKLHGIKYALPVASAQVKSAIILAALTADGETEITEKGVSRNHTEIMLKEFGGKISVSGKKIFVSPFESIPKGRKIFVPNDFSSAAYFIAAALITKNSSILLKDTGINETRSYFLKKLSEAGAKVSAENIRIKNGEKIADIYAESSDLKGVSVLEEEVPLLIDELPLIAVLGAVSEGKTVIRGAKELRFKETDRIKAVCKNLKALGVPCGEFEDGLEVHGVGKIEGGSVDSFGDHRIAMSFSVLALSSKYGITVKGAECVKISFPEFFNILKGVANG